MKKLLILSVLLFTHCMSVERGPIRGGAQTMLVQGHHWEWAPFKYCHFGYSVDLKDLMEYADEQVKTDEVILCLNVERDKSGIYATLQDNIIRAYCLVIKRSHWLKIKNNLVAPGNDRVRNVIPCDRQSSPKREGLK